MDGNLDKIIDDLFSYTESAVEKTLWPYVSFIIKDNVVVARDFNTVKITGDPSLECSVSAIRELQKSLETNDLSDFTLLSLFEPTILSFDVALWAQIKSFIWCINAKSMPIHYFTTNYSPSIYAKTHKDIKIVSGVREKEAIELVNKLESKGKYFGINLD